jgi:hypothetical protein
LASHANSAGEQLGMEYDVLFDRLCGLGPGRSALSGTAPASTSTPVLVFRPARSRASRIAASATASGASPSSANPRSLCTNTWRCCPPPPPGSPTGEQGRRENAGPQAAARTRPARGRRDHQVRAIIPCRRRGLDFVRLIAVNLGQRVAARKGQLDLIRDLENTPYRNPARHW